MDLKIKTRTVLTIMATMFGLGLVTATIVIGMIMEGFHAGGLTALFGIPAIVLYGIYWDLSTTNQITN